MQWSFRRIFLLLIIISLASVFSFTELEAQEKLITAKSIGFEKTTIIEFKNSEGSKSNIDTFRMWLGSDYSFKSFKTEKGWIGEKTPQGVIVFTTTKPIKAGEVVKFGLKTDKPKPGINWKAIDVNDEQIGTGKTLVSESESIEPEVSSNGGIGILEDSTFRLIPDKPNVGSSMRVTGDNFGANEKIDLYIGNIKITSFNTDKNGHFMITSKVPEGQDPGRIDFVLKDSKNNEKSISYRISESDDRMAQQENIKLTISATPPVFYRGDNVKVTGTAEPGGTVTATIKDESGNIVTTIAVEVDFDGNWEYEGIVAVDTPFGKQTAEITDGTNTILRTWEVKSSKIIEIYPLKVMFEPGQTIIFNGTVLPSQTIEFVLEDPQGTEFLAQIINVNSSGKVRFEVPTERSSTEGTYILFATQGDDTEIILVGLGELPVEQLIVKPDKLNYSSGENATLSIQGPASSSISLLVIDPSDKTKFSDSVILQPDGRAEYELDLKDYGSGVYTVVLTRGNAQATEIFSVGLQAGSGKIDVRTTKDSYSSGESILILGSSAKNILLTLSLIDPDGNVVKTKDTFTNKDGVFSENSFRIPLEPKVGTWTVYAKSGPNFDEAEIDVVGEIQEGMIIFAEIDDSLPAFYGKIISITGYGAAESHNIVISALDPDGVEIEKDLSVISTKEGAFLLKWTLPDDIIPGLYTIIAKDSAGEAKTTIQIN